MDHVWIEAVKSFKEFTKGEKYQVSNNDAQELVEAGIAIKCADPANELFEKFSKTLDERDNAIVEKLSAAVSKPVQVKLPAEAKSVEDKGSLGEFLTAVGKTSPSYDNKAGKEKAYDLLANKYSQKSNLNQGTNATAGGFLVPEQWAQELIYQSGYEGVCFPNNVKMFPMDGHYLHLPTLDQTVTPSGAGDSAFYGGCQVAFVAEGTAPGSNTQPAFKSTLLTAKKLIATSQVTRELLDNSPISVEPMLQMLLGDTVKAKINHRILNGSGGSSDLTGYIGNAATISAVRKTANQINYRDVARMFSKLAPSSRKRAKWIVNPWALESLYQMTDASGRAVYLPGYQSANELPKDLLFGMEVLSSEAAPAVGSAGDITLYDPGAYFVGINKNVTIDASEHFAFTSDIITFRITVRLDGNLALTAPIYLMDGVSQVSPFVQLSATVGS